MSPSPPQPRAAASLCKRLSLLFSPACGEGISAELFRLNNAELLNLRRFQPAEAQRAFSLRRRQSAARWMQSAAGLGVSWGVPGRRRKRRECFFLEAHREPIAKVQVKGLRCLCLCGLLPAVGTSVSPGRCLSSQGRCIFGFPQGTMGFAPQHAGQLCSLGEPCPTPWDVWEPFPRETVLPSCPCPTCVPFPAQHVSLLITFLCAEKITGVSKCC